MNKFKTQVLLTYSSRSDEYIRNIDSKYNFNFPVPCNNKTNDYLLPYQNFHIIDNYMNDMGTLEGIRNYIHIGALDSLENIWYSYKYKTINDIDLNDSTFSILDYSNGYIDKNVNREWIENEFNEKITNKVMKRANKNCPWGKEIQNLIGCQCPLSSECNGFCTFPVSGKLNSINGIYSSPIIIPSADYHRELITETDCTVFDDIEIYFVNNNSKDLIEKVTGNLLDTNEHLSALFQGFGGYIHNNKTENFNYLAINNCIKDGTNNILNGYNISKYTPFNTSHTIKAGTKLFGLNPEDNAYMDYLPSGYVCIIKPVAWWSNNVGFKGKIKEQAAIRNADNTVLLDKFENILNIVSNYDYIECNKGFFKFRQNDLHKSNIYSIKLKNSGLNPENDIIINEFSEGEVIKKLELSGQPTYENAYTGNGTNYNAKYKNARFVISESKSENERESAIPGWEQDSNNNKIYYKSFEELCDEMGWVYDEEKGKYYNSNIEKTNEIRNSMRNLMEQAVRKSVSKYLPADTTLWKVLYEGK